MAKPTERDLLASRIHREHCPAKGMEDAVCWGPTAEDYAEADRQSQVSEPVEP